MSTIYTNGPAIEYADDDKLWFINGKLHRENYPAIKRTNSDKVWYINGKLYRKNGPAIKSRKGDKIWFINGKRLDRKCTIEKQLCKFISDINFLVNKLYDMDNLLNEFNSKNYDCWKGIKNVTDYYK